MPSDLPGSWIGVQNPWNNLKACRKSVLITSLKCGIAKHRVGQKSTYLVFFDIGAG